MNVTIVPEDKAVVIDGRLATVDFPIGFPANYHAIQWDGMSGEIQTKHGDNIAITNLNSFQNLIDQALNSFALEDAPPSLEAQKAEKKTAVDFTLQDKLAAGVEYPPGSGKKLQLREQDLVRINAQMTHALVVQANPAAVAWPENFGWRMADDTIWPVLTPEQMTLLAYAAQQAVYALLQASWVHKSAIDQLTTEEEISAYDVTQGWPL